MQPHSNKMSQSCYLRAMGEILTFPVWEVLWEVHVPVDVVEPPSAVHRRPGWDEQVQEVHLQILLIKLPRKGSFAVLCALTTLLYFLLLLANHESAGNTSASTLGKSHGNVINVLRDFSTGWSITILRIIRELLFSGTDGKHTSASALVASLSPASLKRWALLSVITNWPSLQPQSCKYDNKGQCL